MKDIPIKIQKERRERERERKRMTMVSNTRSSSIKKEFHTKDFNIIKSRTNLNNAMFLTFGTRIRLASILN